MNCPNGWTDCNLCAFKRQCDDGTYVPELEDNELEVDLGIVIEDVVEPIQVEQPEIEKARGTWAERFLALSPDDALKEFYSRKVQGLHHKDPIPLDGPSAPGGGSKAKVKKNKKGNKVYTDVWEGV